MKNKKIKIKNLFSQKIKNKIKKKQKKKKSINFNL